MRAYKFYLYHPTKNYFELIGVLPERRIDPERISDESIVNWGRKYFGHNVENNNFFITETTLNDSETGFFLPLSETGR